nr:MAG: Replication initiator protein A (RepA) N-terminus [Bacteriophage sp.]
MSKRFNVNENIEKLYIEIPKALIYEAKYRKQDDHKGLSNEAKLLYGILLDKTYLSIFKAREEGNKNFIDENGDAFIYFDNASIEYVLQISNKKAIQVKKELVKFNLLEEVQQGLGFTNRLYLKTVDIDHDKLIQYIDDISAASKATNTVRKLKLKKWREDQSLKCKKYTTVENATVQEVDNAETIGNTLKCKNDITEMYNLHISNTDFSNTDISMYVCSDESQIKTILDLYKNKIGEVSLIAEKELKLLEGKLDLDLCDLIFIKAKNNKRVNDLEKYIVSKLKKLAEKNIKTISEYEADVKSYSEKTYNKKVYRTSNNNSTGTPKTRFHNINETFKNYQPDELEKMLKEGQQDKLKNKDNTQEVDMDAIREIAIDILQERINSDDTMFFKPQVRFKLDDFKNEINEICNELLNS